MARPLPKHPRTRIEEILRARGLTQKELIERTGWTQAHVNRVVIGRVHLTPGTARALARVLDCPLSALYGDIGEPLPPTRTRQDMGGLPERLAAIASVLGTDWEGLLRYVLDGDYSGLPPALAERLQVLVER